MGAANVRGALNKKINLNGKAPGDDSVAGVLDKLLKPGPVTLTAGNGVKDSANFENGGNITFDF